eukprot:4232405-Pyramimonas_sp.AAC.1
MMSLMTSANTRLLVSVRSNGLHRQQTQPLTSPFSVHAGYLYIPRSWFRDVGGAEQISTTESPRCRLARKQAHSSRPCAIVAKRLLKVRAEANRADSRRVVGERRLSVGGKDEGRTPAVVTTQTAPQNEVSQTDHVLKVHIRLLQPAAHLSVVWGHVPLLGCGSRLVEACVWNAAAGDSRDQPGGSWVRVRGAAGAGVHRVCPRVRPFLRRAPSEHLRHKVRHRIRPRAVHVQGAHACRALTGQLAPGELS